MAGGRWPDGNAKSIAVIGVSAIAGAALTTLALTPEFPTHAGHHSAPLHHDHGLHSSRTAAWNGRPTFYSDMADVNARMHEGMETSPSGNADRDFMRLMIPHHQGAINMAVVLLKYGRDEKLKRLAQSIIVEQGQEIAYMRTLLDKPDVESADTGRALDK